VQGCRLIESGRSSAAFNMAADEFLLSRRELSLRIYGWNPPAVSIGYFQKLFDEVDVEECRKSGVDVVRRMTGGGAVFHDKEITYSFVVPENSFLSSDLYESYSQVCGAVIRGLEKIGISSEFRPVNDIIVGVRKISGNAQTRRNSCILQHGTVIVDVSPEKMFRFIRVNNEKMKGRALNLSDYVTSVIEQKPGILASVVYQVLSGFIVSGFAEKFGLVMDEKSFSVDEMNAIKEISGKYSRDEWNMWR